MDLSKIRNIGISAHIDSGKTTLTERILFYSNKIHTIHEVRGKDGVGATMDSMELERERGITIASAATSVTWKDKFINIIDTPGHVDFTIEVERALRVLDGAILVLCAVAGVQSQSITVDRQLKRYGVPRLAFVNKSDRVGANPLGVAKQLRDKLGLNPILMQLPIGLEDEHAGSIDLVAMKGHIFEGADGTEIKEIEIPTELLEDAKAKREEMLDGLSHFSDTMMELLLEEKEVPVDLIHETVRKATIELKMVPVFIGSAYKNKGVQLLLDAVSAYLPSPKDIQNVALDLNDEEKEVQLVTDPSKPTVALGFKLEDGQYGQLTYVRVYQGSVKKGQELMNTRSRKKFKVGRLIKMHSNHMEDIEESLAGDIVALFGVEAASGDTFCDPALDYSMTSMYVPEPVISLSITAKDKKSADNIGKALNRFTKEDPTFRSFVDPESRQTIIQGMGELHLEVYVERMKREYKAEVETGAPQVAYREAISAKAEFNYTHKKQSGGSGQYGRVAGFVEPLDPEGPEFEFVNNIKGGVIPTEYIPSCERGFKESLKRGALIGFPIMGVKVTLNDGQFHQVDSSDMAFHLAAQGAFREVYEKAKPVILEPIMKVTVEGPSEFQGNILGSINQRRGMIIGTSGADDGSTYSTIEAEVPLSEMFGYSTDLRSMSQGKAEFSMEFSKYARVPASLTEELKKKFANRRR